MTLVNPAVLLHFEAPKFSDVSAELIKQIAKRAHDGGPDDPHGWVAIHMTIVR